MKTVMKLSTPFGTFRSINPNDLSTMDQVLDQLFGTQMPAGQSADTHLTLPVDILERDEKFVVQAFVPGVDANDISITVEQGFLILSAEIKPLQDLEGAKVYQRENRYGSFGRKVKLPVNLDLDAISAESKNGFVSVIIPKRTPVAPLVLQIPIRVLDPDNLPRGDSGEQS